MFFIFGIIVNIKFARSAAFVGDPISSDTTFTILLFLVVGISLL